MGTGGHVPPPSSRGSERKGKGKERGRKKGQEKKK